MFSKQELHIRPLQFQYKNEGAPLKQVLFSKKASIQEHMKRLAATGRSQARTLLPG
jgi:hypothetical protein